MRNLLKPLRPEDWAVALLIVAAILAFLLYLKFLQTHPGA